jgi:hypothetical protein
MAEDTAKMSLRSRGTCLGDLADDTLLLKMKLMPLVVFFWILVIRTVPKLD